MYHNQLYDMVGLLVKHRDSQMRSPGPHNIVVLQEIQLGRIGLRTNEIVSQAVGPLCTTVDTNLVRRSMIFEAGGVAQHVRQLLPTTPISFRVMNYIRSTIIEDIKNVNSSAHTVSSQHESWVSLCRWPIFCSHQGTTVPASCASLWLVIRTLGVSVLSMMLNDIYAFFAADMTGRAVLSLVCPLVVLHTLWRYYWTAERRSKYEYRGEIRLATPRRLFPNFFGLISGHTLLLEQEKVRAVEQSMERAV